MKQWQKNLSTLETISAITGSNITAEVKTLRFCSLWVQPTATGSIIQTFNNIQSIICHILSGLYLISGWNQNHHCPSTAIKSFEIIRSWFLQQLAILKYHCWLLHPTDCEVMTEVQTQVCYCQHLDRHKTINTPL